MKIAAVQLEPVVGDVAENLRRCRALGDEAGASGAEWIVLPEFFATGMGFTTRDRRRRHAVGRGRSSAPPGAGGPPRCDGQWLVHRPPPRRREPQLVVHRRARRRGPRPARQGPADDVGERVLRRRHGRRRHRRRRLGGRCSDVLGAHAHPDRPSTSRPRRAARQRLGLVVDPAVAAGLGHPQARGRQRPHGCGRRPRDGPCTRRPRGPRRDSAGRSAAGSRCCPGCRTTVSSKAGRRSPTRAARSLPPAVAMQAPASSSPTSSPAGSTRRGRSARTDSGCTRGARWRRCCGTTRTPTVAGGIRGTSALRRR